MHAAVLLALHVLGGLTLQVRGSNAPGCVICPSYVALSSQDKLAVLWNKTTQGVYTTGNQVCCWCLSLAARVTLLRGLGAEDYE